MRLADYVVSRIREHVDTCFTVAGGGAIFLNDALAQSQMRYIACHHEQAAAMAAESYARLRTGLGVAVVTSGPGGTNAITGVVGAWTDNIPTLTISGQCFLKQTIRGHAGLRTMGVQEINIVDIVKPITKYAAMVDDPQTIRCHMDKALHLAFSGRPGPVWLDIPADVQNAKIDPDSLPGYAPPRVTWDADVSGVVELLKSAKRPLLHVGQGVRWSGALADLYRFIDGSQIPVLTARNANDVIDSGHALYVGRPGTFAQRGANFAVQNCDVYIAVGTRLCLAQTGYNASDYARNAKIVMVDVDRAELDKNTVPIHIKIHSDAGYFLRKIASASGWPDWSAWLSRCKAWQSRYGFPEESDGVNSYRFVRELSELLTKNDVVVTDMGYAFQTTHQAFRVKLGQRLYTNGGTAAMGWGLPAAVGAAVSGRRTICITGDGGLMMNAQELSTIRHHNLNVKIFLLNNGGYLTMRQSQDVFGRHFGSDEDSGLSFPDFGRIAEAHRIPFYSFDSTDGIDRVLSVDGPVFCELKMDADQVQVKSINRRLPDGSMKATAIEDAYPFLDPKEIEDNLRMQ